MHKQAAYIVIALCLAIILILGKARVEKSTSKLEKKAISKLTWQDVFGAI